MDFVAELGTPVYATGNGVVSSAGLEAGGYGNCVRIRHGFGYETVYAHLMSVSVRSGMRVSRGQKIGLLGSTGKSTGPHLHYELRIDGVQRDPTKVILPTAPPIAKKDLNNFQKETQTLVARLNFMRSIHLAALE